MYVYDADAKKKPNEWKSFQWILRLFTRKDASVGVGADNERISEMIAFVSFPPNSLGIISRWIRFSDGF